jgi:aminopeptidase N
MTSTSPETVHRSDYRPLAWTVASVELHLVLGLDETEVRSRLQLRRNPAAPPGPLVLLGEALTTVSVTIDGKPPPGLRQTGTRLEVDLAGEAASAEIVTRIHPSANSALSGLYASRGGLFSQCEAEGFRRITWFPDRPDVMARYTVTLEADAQAFPVLLSNGNLVEAGSLPGGRHFTRWVDPFPKPSYLFAVVAARLVANERRIRVRSGREVLLQLWVEAKDLDRTGHAMDSLVRAIRWDEERFGLELDLDRFMVVAVSDFNMGAMENKGLNLFNSKLLLARPDTATDADHEHIEAVIGHEYFHNWTGNRVTCRDWFQLTLKEGLTVFRDQEFTADLLAAEGGASARAVKRIDDVQVLRAVQFPEDAGPMAHPIRPQQYQEINNFYTPTVYDKGAEVIRMLATLLGREAFRKGMDLYFQRHDGQAVTCEDFVHALADANHRDLSQFLRWYEQAGTPRLRARGRHDAATGRYTLELEQSGHPEPLVMPVAVALLGERGEDLPLQLEGEAAPGGTTRLLELTRREARFTFTGVAHPPVLSLLRGYSAPVAVELDEDDAALAFRMAHDGDPFNRWDAAQRFMARTVLGLAAAPGPRVTPEPFLRAWGALLETTSLDPGYHAKALGLPSEAWLLEQMRPVEPARLRAAMVHLTRELGRRFEEPLQALLTAMRSDGPWRYHPGDAGRRALGGLCLRLLAAGGSAPGLAAATQRLASATNMTDELSSLQALLTGPTAGREAALATFARRHAGDALVLDKWFGLQAGAWRWDDAATPVLERVRLLLTHQSFSRANPNNVHALLGTFFRFNPGEFHLPDGSGHAFWAEQVLALDALNPQVAARQARALEQWRAFAPGLQGSMRQALEQVASAPKLSTDVGEIVSKALGRGG